MNRSLENIRLVLLRDEHAPPMWLDRWAHSYPTIARQSLSGSQNISQWQHTLNQTLNALPNDETLMLVAHGAAANALIAWYAQSSTAQQKRIAAIILAAPCQNLCHADADHTFARTRFNNPTALVCTANDPFCPQDWAAQQAQIWHAKALISPHTGHLDVPLDGWQWGMKLMQEMLLD